MINDESQPSEPLKVPHPLADNESRSFGWRVAILLVMLLIAAVGFAVFIFLFLKQRS